MKQVSPDFTGNFPRSTRALSEWLAKADPAPVLDAEIPIIDPHHHLFGSDGDTVFYELEDLRKDLDTGHRIIGTIYVEAYESGWRKTGPKAMRPVGEIEKIVELTREPLMLETGPCQVAAKIIGHADLSLGDAVAEVLDAEIVAANGRLCGIRHRTATIGGAIGRTIKDPPRPHLMLDRGFQKGVRQLGARGLTFDAWVYHTQLPELIALADAAPDTVIIIDHFGGPVGVEEFRSQRTEVLRGWERDLRALAERPNIRMKIGGMGMPVYGFDLHRREMPPSAADLAAHWRPLVETTFDIFGTSRCMFESNFPVDKQSTTYSNLWNAFKVLTKTMSFDEKSSVFFKTACNVYGLNIFLDGF